MSLFKEKRLIFDHEGHGPSAAPAVAEHVAPVAAKAAPTVATGAGILAGTQRVLSQTQGQIDSWGHKVSEGGSKLYGKLSGGADISQHGPIGKLWHGLITNTVAEVAKPIGTLGSGMFEAASVAGNMLVHPADTFLHPIDGWGEKIILPTINGITSLPASVGEALAAPVNIVDGVVQSTKGAIDDIINYKPESKIAQALLAPTKLANVVLKPASWGLGIVGAITGVTKKAAEIATTPLTYPHDKLHELTKGGGKAHAH